jgi:hypothetical protein
MLAGLHLFQIRDERDHMIRTVYVVFTCGRSDGLDRARPASAAVITTRSVQGMGLKVGDRVAACHVHADSLSRLVGSISFLIRQTASLRQPFRQAIRTKRTEHSVWLITKSFRGFADDLLRGIGNARVISRGERHRRVVETGLAPYITKRGASLQDRHR